MPHVCFHLADAGGPGETLFGMLACLFSLLAYKADPTSSAEISIPAVLGFKEAEECRHRSFNAAESASAVRMMAEVQLRWQAIKELLDYRVTRAKTSAVNTTDGSQDHDNSCPHLMNITVIMTYQLMAKRFLSNNTFVTLADDSEVELGSILRRIRSTPRRAQWTAMPSKWTERLKLILSHLLGQIARYLQEAEVKYSTPMVDVLNALQDIFAKISPEVAAAVLKTSNPETLKMISTQREELGFRTTAGVSDRVILQCKAPGFRYFVIQSRLLPYTRHKLEADWAAHGMADLVFCALLPSAKHLCATHTPKEELAMRETLLDHFGTSVL
ncbi:hypothetical protein diail_418 [Diaporthe ilicicola]|nr:hypothetical protein diail_418 [Diaporthe ilicicola]